jgi:hypothetical protein
MEYSKETNSSLTTHIQGMPFKMHPTTITYYGKNAFTNELECNCHFLAGTAGLTTMHYTVFLIQVK